MKKPRHSRGFFPSRCLVVGDDGKVLLLSVGRRAGEEGLELLEGRVHRDDAVLVGAAAAEADHGRAELVVGLDPAGFEHHAQLGDRDVAQECPCLAVDDGQVGVVALEGRVEGCVDGVGGG